MLPIRLGMVNAEGTRSARYALTRRGRVETTNYRPCGAERSRDSTYVESEFAEFYRRSSPSRFAKKTCGPFSRVRVGHGWCDPCAAGSAVAGELRALGVFWSTRVGHNGPRRRQRGLRDPLASAYDAAHFPRT